MGKSSFLIKASNLRKSYGDRTIFKIDSLLVRHGDRIGLVGPNGAGKSTLLSVLSGETEPDDGSVDARGTSALIRQEPYAGELRSAGHGEPWREKPMLNSRELSLNPSGGELSKAAIHKAFSLDPDVLFADEPTTNLDAESIRELRGALSSFRGAVVMISHDRSLLDDVCGKIWELSDGALREFPGNY